MKRVNRLSRFSVVVYWLILLVLLGLFFTNDFGLVDIHKTAIITAVGIDYEENEVKVTAQIAVPRPSQSGDDIQYTEVQGSGLTFADALNEINAKTGYYPKLLFCKLFLVGESCQSENIFRILGCLFRKDFSELTALVAMCKGSAADMLKMPTSLGDDMTAGAIQRALTDELKKSANVSTVNLKSLAMNNFSESAACYMPYIEANKAGTSQSGGNGDSAGGETQSGGGQGGQSGSGGSSGGSGGASSQSGGESGSDESKAEFTARKTAIFSRGEFMGIIDEHQSFALDLLKNEIRLAVVPCDAGGKHYTLGLKDADGGVGLKVKNGVPELTLSFKARAQIQGVAVPVKPNKTVNDDVVSDEVLKAAQEEIENRMGQLVKTCVEKNCDVLGARDLLHKKNYKYFEAFKDDVLQRMKVNYKIEIKSLN